jgi:hypothetical protein
VIADVPRVKLSELVGRFGPGLSRDARQCKALLADVCGNQYRGECAVLVAAVEEGVAGELLGSSSGLPTEVLLGRLSDRLHENRGVSSDLARWSLESWAVALGIAAGGDTLAKFKMDGLAPLIDLAGADGAITDAELNHLVAQAKARGVSEADARAYLSAYAGARQWQLGRPQRRRPKAAPQPPLSPAPSQPQPAHPVLPAYPQPTPDRTYRWAAAGVVALSAIAIIVAVARIKPPQPIPPAAPIATAPVPVSGPAPDIALRQRQAETERYNAARGNIAALKAYVNNCAICAYASAAKTEISRLETAQPKPEAVAPVLGAHYQRAACGSIIDTRTGLQWYLGPDTNIGWEDATQWTRQLAACGGGWALPTLTQLKGLFDQTVSAGTGFYTNGRYWPAHIDPIFSGIGGGSWVWADGDVENATALAINFNQGIGVRLSTPVTRYPVRAFAVKTAPILPSQAGDPYTQGESDWRAYKAWSDAQTGERRAGVNYWAANRNVLHHIPCDEEAEEYGDNPAARTVFAAGCEDAERWLDPIDARRANPQYRAGFNDEAARSPVVP